MTFPVLEGKVAIVTGAAMGMGEATEKLFAEAKAKVVVVDFNEEKGRATVEDIIANGGEAAFVKVDISKSEQVQDMPNVFSDHGQEKCVSHFYIQEDIYEN